MDLQAALQVWLTMTITPSSVHNIKSLFGDQCKAGEVEILDENDFTVEKAILHFLKEPGNFL